MTPAVVLGWILTVLGVLFLILALVAAAMEVFSRGGATPKAATGPGGVTNTLQYVYLVLRQLARLPLWMACFLGGLVLIVVGQRLANGQSIPWL
jgi:hypothetical protein